MSSSRLRELQDDDADAVAALFVETYGDVRLVDAEEIRSWLANEAKPAPANALFDSKCGSCHEIRGSTARSDVGPDLTHVGSRTSLAAATIPNTPARMREWIRDPQGVKPGNTMPAVPLTDAQLSQLVDYLEARK